MNLFLTVVLFALCCTPVLRSQTAINKNWKRAWSPQTTTKAQLQLTTEVVKEEYYWNSLELNLRLTFSNVGRVPVILSKRSLGISYDRVSRDLEKLAARQYEQQGKFLDDFGSTAIFDPPVETDFVVIPPGGKYEMESDRTNVYLTLDRGNAHAPQALSAGNYVLEVVVGTWLYIAVDDRSQPHVQDERFRDEWKDRGFLWSDPLTSLAMPFKVDRDRMSKCVN